MTPPSPLRLAPLPGRFFPSFGTGDRLLRTVGCLAAFSRAGRSAVRFSAAAFDAFLARADRSAAVIRSAAFLPPSLPNLREISFIAARTSGGIFMLMLSIVHLTLYGTDVGKKATNSS